MSYKARELMAANGNVYVQIASGRALMFVFNGKKAGLVWFRTNGQPNPYRPVPLDVVNCQLNNPDSGITTPSTWSQRAAIMWVYANAENKVFNVFDVLEKAVTL